MKLFARKTAKTPSAKERRQKLLTPERDWKMIFIAFVTFNICMLALHAFIFFTLSQGGFYDVPEADSGAAEAVNENLLESALDYFREKEAALIQNMTTPANAPEVR